MSFMPGHTPPESCQPPPEPPSHSPSSARASTSRRSCSCNWPVSEAAWPVARMQTLTSAASRVVETASREPLGMLFTLLTISKPRPGPTMRASKFRQALARALDARRHDARGDDRRLEQAQVVLGKVEHLRQVGDVRRRAQVHADQAQQRFFDDPQVGFDRRARRGVAAMHAEVNGDIEHLGPFRESPCPGRRCRSSRNA